MVCRALETIRCNPATDMSKTLLILILLTWTCTGLCAEGTDDVSGQPPWFQIELLIFSHEKSTPDDEFWPLADIRYPPEMVIVGPEQDELLKPINLGQLRDIIEYQKILEATSAYQPPGMNSENNFLFDNPRRSSTRRNGSTALDEEDLMSGLNPDIPEPEYTPSDQPVLQYPAANIDPSAPDISESMAVELEDLFNAERSEAYRALPPAQLSLRADKRRLQRSPNYRVLYHTAWRQPILAMEQSIPILIQAGERFDDYYELDGTVTISLARFLHIDTDLWFTSFLPRFNVDQSGLASQSMSGLRPDERELLSQYPDLYEFESRRDSYIPYQTYKLVQSRRMRSSKIHYLDHPAFGLMLQITEYQLEEDGPGDT
jgi:hypothetical protein